MGELARFEDIRIKMYPMDTQKHKEPHFHIILTDGNKASISIANGKILEEKLNKRQKDYIKAWMLIHKEELKKLSIIDGTIEWECGAELSNDTF